MLSDSEQRRLTEIENQLRADDPAAAQRFGGHGQHRPPPKWHRATIALAVATVVVGRMVHSNGLVVVALTVAGDLRSVHTPPERLPGWSMDNSRQPSGSKWVVLGFAGLRQ